MTGVNRTIWINANEVLTPARRLEQVCVKIQNGRVAGLGDWVSEADFEGARLIPGMLDLHINGTRGADAAEGTEGALRKMAAALATDGVTGFLPTLISDREEGLVTSLRKLGRVLDATRGGARALGIHLEGPFLSLDRRGAHPPEALQPPSIGGLQTYREASGDTIRKLTIAPELPGALEVIECARRDLPIVSLGHSAADFETAQRAFRAGANAITHVFNAMDPLHHRRPGLLAAALGSAPQIMAEFIGDGVHVHPEMIRLLARCKGLRSLVLVTDAVSAAGMPDGDYRVGGVTVHLRRGVCRDAEGRLAGSALRMDEGLRHLVEWFGPPAPVQLKLLVAMATRQPARLLGLQTKGVVRKGADADLVMLDEQLRVIRTWVEGELVHDAGNRS